jgi:hypothetical protein
MEKALDDQDKRPRTSLYEQMEFNGSVEKIFSLIEESTNPRIIIIETWLIIDYAIRKMLFVGLELQYRSAYFKPLSDSFERNLALLFNLIQEQKKLLPRPIDYTLHLPKGFFMFCYQNHPDEFKILQKLEYQFYEWIMSQNVAVRQLGDLSKFRFVSEEWMEVAEGIDSNWKTAAMRLNKARNSAAHIFDTNELFKSLDLTGTEEIKLKLLRDECSSLLNFLLGIKDKK